MLPFERSEYAQRLQKTKLRMAQEGIDILLSTDPANMNYLTGYDGWSFYVPQMVVIAIDESMPYWIGRGIDANGAKVTTYLAPENIRGYHDDYVHSVVRHPMEFVADQVIEQGWGKRAIGLEMDSYYFSPQGYESLRQRLPNAVFKNANALVNWIRVVKSPAEIAKMQAAARILEKVMQVAIDAVRPGVRQCDAAAAIVGAEIAGTPETGGDYTAIVPMLPSGIGTSTPHLTWTDEPFRAGEGTILELAACRQRYHCPMARTVFLGKPSTRVEDTAKVVVEGLNAALNAAKPGAMCEEVEAAWRTTVAKSGLVKDSRIGYSTGLNYPPDWGEHTLSLRPGDKTVLQPNMTIHCIPGIWKDDWGIEISECFRVTDGGASPLANVPRRLFVKE